MTTPRMGLDLSLSNAVVIPILADWCAALAHALPLGSYRLWVSPQRVGGRPIPARPRPVRSGSGTPKIVFGAEVPAHIRAHFLGGVPTERLSAADVRRDVARIGAIARGLAPDPADQRRIAAFLEGVGGLDLEGRSIHENRRTLREAWERSASGPERALLRRAMADPAIAGALMVLPRIWK